MSASWGAVRVVCRLALVGALVALLVPAAAAGSPMRRDTGGWDEAVARIPSGVKALAADDDIPGVALGASPVVSTLNWDTDDYLDVYSVSLTAGQVFTVDCQMPSGRWFFTALMAPGSTSVYVDDPVVISDTWDATHERMSYYARTTGTYYLVVMIADDADGAGAYTLTWQTSTLSGDDDIPGAVAPPASPVPGTLDWRTDVSDVYYFDLNGDDQLQLTLTGPAGTAYGTGGFDMFLYQPGTTSAWDVTQPPATWSINDGTSSESITYLCPPGGGRVHLEVSTDIHSGGYTLSYTVAHPKVARLSGGSRYQTCYCIGKSNVLTSTAVVLATGRGYADALAGSGLAGALDAPLLLVPQSLVDGDGYLTQDAIDLSLELMRIDPTDVYIVGGTGAVSGTIEQFLVAMGWTVHRIAGSTRYDTARAIADEMVTLVGAPTAAFVVRGDSFADALAASPYAFSQRMPILLTPSSSLYSGAGAFIDTHDITDVVIVGGAGAVSSGVEASIEALNGGFDAHREAGVSRYGTAADLAEYAIGTRSWASWGFVGLATGRNFPDALGGGAACGMRNGALLLTDSTSLSAPTQAALQTHAGSVQHAHVFGGTGAVSSGTYSAIQSALGP